ncbi:MAG TPA: sulfotransferase [Steroidobacteraceae bacterium]
MTEQISSDPGARAYQLMCSGKLLAALPLAEQAVAGQHTCLPVHGMLATLLLQLGRTADAEAVVAQALECRQGSADAYDALAHVSMLLGNHERSNALYRRAVDLAPDDPRLWYNLASSERSFGRLVEAEAACDKAIALNPAQHATYLLRSELRVQSQDQNHIAELKSQLSARNLSDRARVLLGYALAKELDDLRQFDAAFHWFSEAARSRRKQLAYDVAMDERKLQRIREAFPKQAVRSSFGDSESRRFVFIIGLPRSGTTLLEHILTGLPAVRSNGETENFNRALMAAAPPDCGDVFSCAAAAPPSAVAANYARLANATSTDEVIIEKLPMNYLYLGAIRNALPQAKLLLVRRAALDSCFAMYRTLFGAAYPFSYDFEDLARYYAAYHRLVAHWRDSFGEAMHEVDYEELVKFPASVGAGVARYCGLDWQDKAVDVHKSASVSYTASAAQIRRPIYGSSSGRWRHYRKHLEPLVRALRHCQIVLPEDA